MSSMLTGQYLPYHCTLHRWRRRRKFGSLFFAVQRSLLLPRLIGEHLILEMEGTADAMSITSYVLDAKVVEWIINNTALMHVYPSS